MKEKKAPQTRANEVILSTMDPEQMMGMYICKDVLHKWTEDFIDEVTNETLSIERSELLFRAGTYVDLKTQQKISFDVLAGTITEPVELSNQNRTGLYNAFYSMRPWLAKVKYNDKVRKFMLMAKGIEHASEVVKDYMETRTDGVFAIIQLGVADWSTFIEDEVTHLTETDLDKMYQDGVISFATYCDALDNTSKDNHPDEDSRTYWQISYKIGWKTKKDIITEGEPTLFVVHSVNADTATKAVLRYLTQADHRERDEKTRKADGEKVFTLQLHEAKQLPIHAIIPIEYTEANDPKKND